MDGMDVLSFAFRMAVYGLIGIFLYFFFRVLTSFYTRRRKPVIVYEDRIFLGMKIPKEWEQAEVEKKDRRIAINMGILIVLFLNIILAFHFHMATLWMVILTAWLFSAAPYVLPSLYKRNRAH